MLLDAISQQLSEISFDIGGDQDFDKKKIQELIEEAQIQLKDSQTNVQEPNWGDMTKKTGGKVRSGNSQYVIDIDVPVLSEKSQGKKTQ